jgi:hypothetical protein
LGDIDLPRLITGWRAFSRLATFCTGQVLGIWCYDLVRACSQEKDFVDYDTNFEGKAEETEW